MMNTAQILGFRRLNYLLAAVGGFAAVSTGIILVGNHREVAYVLAFAISIVFAAVNVSLAFVREPARWHQLVQASVVLAIGLVSAVMADPAEYGGMLLCGVGIALLAKAKGLRSPLAVFLFAIVITTVDVAIAVVFQQASLRVVLATTAISMGSFGILYYAFHGELSSALQSLQKLTKVTTTREKLIVELERVLEETGERYQQAKEQVRTLTGQIETLKDRYSPVDIPQFKITAREEDVIRTLVQTSSSNKEIAYTLGIAERTVKAYFTSIHKKVGTQSRVELIDVFQHNRRDLDAEDQATPAEWS